METKIEKEVRYLKIYAVVSTLFFAIFLLSAFALESKKKFQEIDVERINIVEKDGKLKMVISNKERQHPGIVDGKTFERKEQRPAGMIFFSEKGDEIGGLIFDGNTGKGQNGSLTFDKFRGDQTIQFMHTEEPDGKYFAGLRLNDQNTPIAELMSKKDEIEKLPTKEARDAAYRDMQDKGLFQASRLDIGRDYSRSSFIKLKDAKGRARIVISVAADGNAKLNFLDENGKVVYSLPDESKAK
ncbi:MAG TPA: hypothetical protein VGO50_04050 [Pyrinomonadaceae bacterium]|jgi:hypothetical protein|nr:hypothetical protein [Pyrinomonadaceae bacterium]